MNNKIYLLLLIAGGLFMTFVSCKDKKDAPYVVDDLSPEYYPLAVNKYVVYDVDSIIWNDSTCAREVRHFRMRYTIVDSFRDQQDRRSYRIEVAVQTDSAGWVPDAVCYVTPTSAGVEYSESGFRFIKLSYPIEEGHTWEGNALIPAREDGDLGYLAGWRYRYQDIGAPYGANAGYDSTVTVIQADKEEGDPGSNPDTYAYRLFSKEIYAHDVGLVYKEYTRVIYDPAESGCRKGFTVLMRAGDHN